jgi:hypothetical protein
MPHCGYHKSWLLLFIQNRDNANNRVLVEMVVIFFKYVLAVLILINLMIRVLVIPSGTLTCGSVTFGNINQTEHNCLEILLKILMKNLVLYILKYILEIIIHWL